jgi:mono/diheme cytochrome c family protein
MMLTSVIPFCEQQEQNRVSCYSESNPRTEIEMARFGEWLGIILFSLVVLLAIAISLTIGWRPILGPRARALTSRTFERTPQRLERGHYIANGLSGCIYCHTPHNWSAPDTPYLEGKEGAGELMPYAGLPGRIVAPNLTPDPDTGAGRWTDDQLVRAIREGISHDGRALFPLMPYLHFRKMSDEDVASVVVYLRSMPSVRNPLPPTEIVFPVKYLIRNAPEPITVPVIEDLPSDPVKRGEQLINLGGCTDCHSPQMRGQTLPGMDFAGGFALEGPWGYVAAANITPDPTGIPYYDEAQFLEVMRTGKVKARALSPVMPIKVYKNLTDDDLKAMFAYLRTIKPAKHRVDNSLPATMCKLCQQKHGAGAEN